MTAPYSDAALVNALVCAFHAATWPGAGDRGLATAIAEMLAAVDPILAAALLEFWWPPEAS